MGESDSEGVPYDDDFEEASDDDRGRSTASLRGAPAQAASMKPPRRHRPAEPPAAGSMCLLDDSREAPPGRLEAPVELSRTGTPGSGPRVVRGKVSVAGAEEGERRPPTGDSAAGAAGQAQAAQGSSKPMWLQFETAPAPRSREQQPNSGIGGDSGARGLSGRSRPPLEPDPFAEGSPEARLAARTSVAGRSRRGDDSLEADSARGGEGDDRKLKRLQQEIQRLTQRLKEAELFSAQDDMLPKFILDEVEVGIQIAQGGFSSVHHASWRCTPCALKKIFDPVITEELRSEFENEVRMLRLLRHPHIVTLMAVCRVPPALSVLTEYIGGGSVFELLHGAPSQRPRHSIEPEPAAILPVILQAAGAVAYLHSMLVVHRDIKTQNVLLTQGSQPIAKLCDFGLARMFSEVCTGTMQWAGTAAYMAPELFAKKRYNEMVDVFAFGTMIWEVVSTEIPHANMDPADIAHRVQSKDGASLPVAHNWPKSLKHLLRTALAVQAESRPSMIEVTRQLENIIMDFPAPE